MRHNGQDPSDLFPHVFPVDGEVANVLRTCYGETGVMDFGLKALASGLLENILMLKREQAWAK